MSPPHQEGDFHQWLILMKEFRKRGWKLEIQAPHGPYPYTNVLDLQVNLTLSLPLPTAMTVSLYLSQTLTLSCKCSLLCQSSTQHSHLLQMFIKTVAGYGFDRI
jgi:hypothetical protein